MSRYMTVWFLACWVAGSHCPGFNFMRKVDREELIDLCRTWQPARIQRVS